jgi:EAL domain-containing protein (putative c-di-GMP-specific phosphodiesterase class I)
VKRAKGRPVLEALARADLDAQKSRPRRAQPPKLDEHDLVRALERAEFMLHYQPIVDLRSGECRRFEALLRWRHPQLGILLPGDFMQLAESSGQLRHIGAWVIDAAKRQWAAWKADGEAFGVSVNISGPEVEGASTVGDMLQLIRPFDPDALTFEVTAATFAEHPRVSVVAQRLAAAGARISLDDVGTADAPGRQLAAGLDEMKLSRSLVARALTEPPALADLRALIELGRDHRLTVVAVGVEDKPTYDLVLSLGCDLAQGYWLSRPLVPDRLAPWRRWAVGVAFTGALAVAAHVGASKAAGASSSQAAATAPGFMPSMCCLDLPYGRADASASKAQEILERTGVTIVEQASERATVYADANVSAATRAEIADSVDADMASLEKEFGRSFATAPKIYVFATRPAFAFALQSVFGVRGPDAGLLAAANGGVTLPRQGVIVINLQNIGAGGASTIVRHELTHALVHERIGPDATLPAWFDEGLATLEERAPAATDESVARDESIALTVLTDGRTTLRELDAPAQWAQHNAVLGGQGYTVAAEAVRLVEVRVGHDGMLRILDDVAGGQTFGAAYAAEAGEALVEFERAFPARLAEAHLAPRILQSTHSDGVRWTIAGFTPSTAVKITIEGVGYRVQYDVTADRYGMYAAVFGSTAPHGEYTVRATGSTGQAVAVLRT